MRPLFSQFKPAKEEHRGRTAALKAVAYQMGDPLRDERNNRSFAFPDHAEGKGVIFNGVRIPSNAPDLMLGKNFSTTQAHAQFLVTSISKFEEKQRKLHPGRNQTGHDKDEPIIGRSDLFLLDARLVYDENGHKRENWEQNLTYAAQDIVREKFTRRGLPAVFSIHDENNGDKNFHIHVTSFYRPLTPEGWATNKVRPYGEAAWKNYWADGAKIARDVQARHLKRLGADFSSWGGDRLSMPPKFKSNDNKKGGEEHDYSTGTIANRYVELCQDPLHDLQGWMDAQGRGRGANHHLPARQGAGMAANDGLRQVRAGSAKSTFDPAAAGVTVPLGTSSPAAATFAPAGHGRPRPDTAGRGDERDPTISGRAQAAFEFVWSRWQGMIDGVMQDRSLTPDQRAAAVMSMRQQQASEAATARAKLIEEEKQNAKERRRLRTKIRPPPAPS